MYATILIIIKSFIRFPTHQHSLFNYAYALRKNAIEVT